MHCLAFRSTIVDLDNRNNQQSTLQLTWLGELVANCSVVTDHGLRHQDCEEPDERDLILQSLSDYQSLHHLTLCPITDGHRLIDASGTKSNICQIGDQGFGEVLHRGGAVDEVANFTEEVEVSRTLGVYRLVEP